MSIISTLEQEEPILVTAKELRRIVAIENDRDYYEFLKCLVLLKILKRVILLCIMVCQYS